MKRCKGELRKAVTLEVRVEPQVAKELDIFCDASGLNRSEALRAALDSFLSDMSVEVNEGHFSNYAGCGKCECKE